MADVVHSDELVRRLQRARACAEREAHSWRERSGPGLDEATVRATAYEAVLRVLDEVLTPGGHRQG
ncbi:hypothetical protein ACL02U_21410 [Streptomyces sp. MS06]|uniref:hypothetical protein n=1 Tax=Streptomyces sp. MS06 TaxID=3385974 RepID=UPI0039A1D56C